MTELASGSCFFPICIYAICEYAIYIVPTNLSILFFSNQHADRDFQFLFFFFFSH